MGKRLRENRTRYNSKKKSLGCYHSKLMTVSHQHLAILPALWLPDGFNEVWVLSTPLLSEGPEQLTLSEKSLPPGGIQLVEVEQTGWYFADDTFKCILLYDILVIISLRFVPKSPFNNKSSLVQVMACRQIGDKPLSEPMMTQFYDAYTIHGLTLKVRGITHHFLSSHFNELCSLKKCYLKSLTSKVIFK